MWLFTKVGFFSVVQSSEPQPKLGLDALSVRSRIEGDLESLRAAYAPTLSETVILPGRDYPYRAYISKEAFAEAMCRAALDLDYDNFKSMVAKVQGYERAHLYSSVWGVMYDADKKLAKKSKR